MTPEQKAWIDTASVYQLLYKNRFEPAGSPWFRWEVGNYLQTKLAKRRDEDPGAYVQASKDMGW